MTTIIDQIHEGLKSEVGKIVTSTSLAKDFKVGTGATSGALNRLHASGMVRYLGRAGNTYRFEVLKAIKGKRKSIRKGTSHSTAGKLRKNRRRDALEDALNALEELTNALCRLEEEVKVTRNVKAELEKLK